MTNHLEAWHVVIDPHGRLMEWSFARGRTTAIRKFMHVAGSRDADVGKEWRRLKRKGFRVLLATIAWKAP